jgi:hypothetical protein
MTVVHTLRPNFDLSDPSTLVFDLANPRPKDVLALVETFEEAIKATPDVGKLPVVTGWNDISPTIGVNLLLRNRPGANRKVDPATVFYYAQQMAKDQWKATGQPGLIDKNGVLQDMQHRLYGGLISGVTFRSFIVTDVEPIPNLFAYIDNSRPRTAATALQTAGHNGVSTSIVKVIKIGEEIKAGVYNPSGADKLPRLSPVEVLELIDNYPNARKAARSAASDWEEAAEYLGSRRDIVGYLGMRIMDLHGEDTAHDFFEEIVATGERTPDDPIAALRKEVDKDARADKPMKRHHMLAALIKTFNAWRKHEPLGRRWMLQVNEDFPTLDPAAEPHAEAAE